MTLLFETRRKADANVVRVNAKVIFQGDASVIDAVQANRADDDALRDCPEPQRSSSETTDT
jgi:hypothetical protein